jgi:hypothetical protein
VSRSAAPPRGSPGPRQAPAPRAAAAAHAPGSARQAGRASAPGYAARDLPRPGASASAPADLRRDAVDVAPAGPRPDAVDAAPGADAGQAGDAAGRSGPARELSGLRQLLDQLDALLRDPTLTLALRRLTRGLGAAARELAASVASAIRRLATLRLRLPRRLMLTLLALLLPLVLLALLWPGGNHGGGGRPPASPPRSGASIAGLGMPDVRDAPSDVPPARVALVVDGSYGPAALRRELRALGSWLQSNHAPATRISVIDASTGRASSPLDGAALARGAPTRPQPSTTAAVSSALRGGGRRLLVRLGSTAPATAASALTIVARRGGAAVARVPLRRGGRARVTIDERRPNALAATVARALMAISGERERR